MNLAVIPGSAELIRRNQNRRQSGAWFGLQESKSLGQFRRDQVSQAHIVDQANQLDMAGGLFRISRHRHVIGDHDNFRFKVNAVIFADHLDSITWPGESCRSSLIHQRVLVKRRRHFRTACSPDALDMGQVSAAVQKLVSPRQR